MKFGAGLMPQKKADHEFGLSVRLSHALAATLHSHG